MDDITDIGSPIKEYISSALKQIKDALPDDARVDGTINIEMSTVLQKEKSGGIRIEVLNLGAKVSENQVHKINIPIRILTETGKAVEDAMKAEAEVKKAVAEKMKRQVGEPPKRNFL
jgi:hypothetical protein